MKAGSLLDDASAEIIGLAWLLRTIAPVSAYGERRFAELRTFGPGEERAAQARAEGIARVADALDASAIAGIHRELSAVPEITGSVARASMGDALSELALFELRRFCAAAQRVDALAPGGLLPSAFNDGVRALADALSRGQHDGEAFYLSAAFDPDLERARAALGRAQAELEAARGRENEHAAAELRREELGEEFIVMRSDLSGALPAGVRVLREAPTYLVCTLQYGETARAALERRDEAAAAVAAVEERARQALSAVVRMHAAELLVAADALGEVDVLTAAAAFARRFACAPAAIGQEAALALEAARYPPLEAELERIGRRFTPLDFDLADVAVLTGPNMGGKSVGLLTCGFAAVCAAFGLPVAAARCRIGLFDTIAWLGIGRETQVGGLLSSFASEVLILKEMLSRGTARQLVLVDEFARTTTPHEGKALLIALLRRLRERRACALVATHIEGLAHAAGVRHFAVRGLRGIPAPPATTDVAEALATLAKSMDYRIEEVTGDTARRADAIALAALLGVDREYVEDAYRALAQ